MAAFEVTKSEATERWQQFALTTEQLLWLQLAKIKFDKPLYFDALSDLEDLELNEELQRLLGKPPSLAEQISFKKLVEASGKPAAQRRKVLLREISLGVGGASSCSSQTQVYTERELLGFGRLKAAALEYPSSTKRKVQTKEDERHNVIRRIGESMARCNFPIYQQLQTSTAPERVMQRLGAGKRLRTLKEKLRVVLLLERWVQAVFGKSFPSTSMELTDYMLDRAEEPCGPSIPRSVLSAVAFFEDLGGVLQARRISADNSLIAMTNELKLELSASRPACKKKAPQLMIAFVVAWEASVCDRSVFDMQRLRIWIKLVKIWSALRTADMSGIPARSLTFEGGILRGKILISKTTGVGKAVGEMVFTVTDEAWLHSQDWLAVGWKLFESSVSDRGFLIPLPSQDFQTLSDKEPSYEQWLTADRKLLAETHVLEEEVSDLSGESTWTSGTVRFLIQGAQLFWSGHSDRGTIPTWAAALNIHEDRINNVGRWCPKASAEYVRVSQDIARGVQSEVSRRIREASGTDVCFENSVLRELAIFCGDRGASAGEIERMLLRLKSGRELLAPASIVLSPSSPEVDVQPNTFEFDELEPTEGWTDLSYGKRVISLEKSGGARTLHQVGSCWRIPGLHYRKFEFLDEGEKGGYHRLCRDCFPKQRDPLDEVVESSDTSSSGNSSSESDS